MRYFFALLLLVSAIALGAGERPPCAWGKASEPTDLKLAFGYPIDLTEQQIKEAFAGKDSNADAFRNVRDYVAKMDASAFVKTATMHALFARIKNWGADPGISDDGMAVFIPPGLGTVTSKVLMIRQDGTVFMVDAPVVIHNETFEGTGGTKVKRVWFAQFKTVDSTGVVRIKHLSDWKPDDVALDKSLVRYGDPIGETAEGRTRRLAREQELRLDALEKADYAKAFEEWARFRWRYGGDQWEHQRQRNQLDQEFRKTVWPTLSRPHQPRGVAAAVAMNPALKPEDFQPVEIAALDAHRGKTVVVQRRHFDAPLVAPLEGTHSYAGTVMLGDPVRRDIPFDEIETVYVAK